MPDFGKLSALPMGERTARTILEVSPASVIMVDTRYRIVDTNNHYAARFGSTREEMIGTDVFEPYPPAFAKSRKALADQVFELGKPIHAEDCRDGVWSDFTLRPVLAENGEVSHVVVHIFNITRQKQVEMELAETSHRLRILNRIAEVFLTLDDTQLYDEVLNILVEATASKFGFFGYIDEDENLVCPTLVGMVRTDGRPSPNPVLFPRESWSGAWGRALEERQTQVESGDLVFPAGHVQLEDVLAVPLVTQDRLVGLLVLADRDGGYGPQEQGLLEEVADRMTPVLDNYLRAERLRQQRDELEARLRHAQKMEAVGQLAGGVAHDFNNLLQVINGYSDLIWEDMEADDENRSYLDRVRTAGMRARDLVQQLLLFSRRKPQDLEPIALDGLLESLARMVERVIGEHIELNLKTSGESQMVLADRGQLEQVVMNLCVNARDAMPDGGRIDLVASSVDLGEAFCASRPWARPGKFALLTVQDNGVGISADHRERIFEPFFTTKEVGKGTGLGLATVYAILKGFEGFVDCRSEEGEGTTFDVFLPLSAEDKEVDPEAAAAAVELGRGETILLVEDDDSVREFARLVLEAAGYQVLAEADGLAAIEVFQQQADEVALVVMDVMMPRMSGHEAWKRMNERRPDLPVLFITGHDTSCLSEEFLAQSGGQMVPKPFTRQALLEQVRRALTTSS